MTVSLDPFIDCFFDDLVRVVLCLSRLVKVGLSKIFFVRKEGRAQGSSRHQLYTTDKLRCTSPLFALAGLTEDPARPRALSSSSGRRRSVFLVRCCRHLKRGSSGTCRLKQKYLVFRTTTSVYTCRDAK